MLLGENKGEKKNGAGNSCFFLDLHPPASPEVTCGGKVLHLYLAFFVDSTFFSPKGFDFHCNQPQFSGTILEYAFHY